PCSAGAASGHAPAAPPSRAMNSRRLMSDMGLPPPRPGLTPSMPHAKPPPKGGGKSLRPKCIVLKPGHWQAMATLKRIGSTGIKPRLPAKRKASEANPDAAVKFLELLQPGAPWLLIAIEPDVGPQETVTATTCPPSALMRPIGWVEEERISG